MHAPTLQEGDIVVTRVARHFNLGRINADQQPQTSLESHNDRATAISRAVVLAGATHRAFLYDKPGRGGAWSQIQGDC